MTQDQILAARELRRLETAQGKNLLANAPVPERWEAKWIKDEWDALVRVLQWQATAGRMFYLPGSP